MITKARNLVLRIVALLAVACSAILLGGGGASAATPAGMPKHHSFCVYSAQTVAQLREFEFLTQRPVDCASLFTGEQDNWSEYVNPVFAQTGNNPTFGWPGWVKADSSRRLIITQWLAPKSGMPSDWLHRAALGEYNTYYAAFARNLVNVGLGASVIRLSPEMNGYWNHDQVPGDAAGQADWRKAWVNAVTAMRSVTGAQFAFDWCVNYRVWGHDRHPIELQDFYPGDAYVDIVGLDAYDENIDQRSGRWWLLVTKEFGVREMYNFAQAHKKPMSYPEWAMLPWGGPMKGGGDNPEYMEGMGNYIATHNVAYSGYWYTRANVELLQNSVQGMKLLRKYFGPNGLARRTTPCASYCP